MCWIVFINLPDSNPFSTLFHPTLCRRNPLHRPPLPGSPALRLLVSSATPRKEEKICICHLAVAVSLQVLAGSLSQGYCSHLLSNYSCPSWMTGNNGSSAALVSFPQACPKRCGSFLKLPSIASLSMLIHRKKNKSESKRRPTLTREDTEL